jgi:geranylgeranyl diphosphate synthase type II
MDKAPVRRGKATVHTKWNENVAILSGDAMLIQSYQYLCDLPSDQLSKCLSVFNEMAIQVCEGQQYDMDFEIQAEVGMDSYLKMIEYKTAVLLGASLKMGAIIGGATEKQADSLYEFGRNIGIAFQLKDDLLDVFGDEQTFGKQVGGDIIANKKTCLYLKALSLSEGKHKMELVNLYSSESVNDTEKVERVKSIYDAMDMQSHIHILIDDYYSKAMNFLNSIDADLSELERFASLLKKREN